MKDQKDKWTENAGPENQEWKLKDQRLEADYYIGYVCSAVEICVIVLLYKKLSCRKEVARCFVSLKVTQGHSKWRCWVLSRQESIQTPQGGYNPLALMQHP